MKKILLIFLAFAMCFSLCACGSKTTTSKSTKITSSAEAIAAVKNDINTENRICRGLGYKFYKDPDYGTCTATKKSDGNWEVTLHGKMWGYYDDAKIDLDINGFVLTATVSEEGTILSASAKKSS